ncbi:MAG: TetR/AcrR family transcriptional regulator C-terminal domain-containing protein [Methanocorpusculum sp.]|uniref:TetR/AcrR family transcriptional regulator C-terminal domain-containing protein n=1 Tax=Methanocorpusculum sp. TaxID=2058474 RepID=UPI00271D9B52|nr:TetR/AcrR family transcriptional regulator C-terminal domain-containing protein [Methanocorpusculum sp.]MDO9522767.1 TetR/AcrR family transcriptional regulator C-terminal domain-containing protein [Methanocorpusculum sp.]
MSNDAAFQSNMTKKMLAASLKKLMRQKPLHKITVQEIVEGCGIHRQTFYYHFRDVYALVQWMYEEEMDSLLVQGDTASCWQDKILQLFNYISENHEVCLCTLNSLSRATLKELFKEDLEGAVREIILMYGENMWDSMRDDRENMLMDGDNISNLKRYREYLTHFYTMAFAGMVENWILGEMNMTPEMIVEYMERLIADQLNGARMRFDLIKDEKPEIKKPKSQFENGSSAT